MEENNSYIKSLSEKGEVFLNKNISLFLFLIGVSIFALLNYVWFGLGKTNISSPWVNQDQGITNTHLSWLGWTELTIAYLGSLITIFGVILTIRLNKKFIFPLLIGETLVIIDAIIIGAIFTGISYFIMIIFAIFNYINWDKNEKNKSMSKNNWIFIVLFLFLYLLFGSLLSNKFIDRSTIDMIFDVFGSGIVIFAWFIVLKKNKYGFLFFLLTDFTYMIYFFTSGVWSTGSSYIVYIFLDSIAFISWIK